MQRSTAASRIVEYLTLLGISHREFNRRTGFSNGLLGHAVKDGRALGSDKLERVLREFPDLDPEWLLMGEGPMQRIEDSAQKQSRSAA